MAVRVHLIIYGLVRVTPGTIVSGCRCRTAGAGGTCFLTAAILTLRLQTYAKKTILAVLLNKNMYYSHNLGRKYGPDEIMPRVSGTQYRFAGRQPVSAVEALYVTMVIAVWHAK